MQADVRSISAMRDWVAALQSYREDATSSLSGIEMEIRRCIDWVEDQKNHWEAVAKKCDEELWTAKQDLNARKHPDWSGRDPDTTVQERNARRAEVRLEIAREQIQKCRGWLLKMPKLIDETYRGASHRLSNFLEGDLARSLALMGGQIASLEAYAGLKPDFAPGPLSS
ncbi:hypothetical protein BH11PLA2_BH11PLA2_05240 [soil metagenome]